MKRLNEKKVFGVLSIIDIAVIVFILAIAFPMLYYYIRFNDKGFIEQKSLERFMANKIRNNVVNQVALRTKDIELDVSFKSMRKDDIERRLQDRRYFARHHNPAARDPKNNGVFLAYFP